MAQRKLRVDKFKYYDLIIYAARNSHGARRLSSSIECRRWRDDLPSRYTRRRPYFRGNSNPMVLNWGSTTHPQWLEDPRFRLNPVFINHAESVGKAIDKLAFFQHLSGIDGIPLLKWTDEQDVANKWLEKGKPVVCRTDLRGSGGDGIVLARTVGELVSAPLYTRYYPKTHEFRVHVFNGKVIDITQKKLKGGSDARSQSNSTIRSLRNGWIHAHDGLVLDELGTKALEDSCVKSIRSLDLHFGAIDVLSILDSDTIDGKRSLKSFRICEVNTGPGLENTKTIEAYAKAILLLRSEQKGTL